MSSIISAWGLVKKICGAAFFVPFGLCLVAIAVWIVSVAGMNWFSALLAGWIGYKGLNAIIGALSGFVGNGGPKMIDTREGAARATRDELRRSGLLKR
jgi:hypothetical protein